MKTFFNIIFRILQIAIIAFFGFWVYLKFTKTGLEIIAIMLTTLPFVIGGLVIGTIVTMIYFLKSLTRKNLALKIYDLVMCIAYIFADVYFLNLIF